MTFEKDGKIRIFKVVDDRVMTTIEIGGVWVSNPTLADFLADGWREWIAPTPEPPTKEQQYKWRVVELIRQRYDADDEMALLRQRETKAEEFAAYNTYCEDCKAQAYQEIYG